MSDDHLRRLMQLAQPLISAVVAVQAEAMRLSDDDLLALERHLENGDIHMTGDLGNDSLIEIAFGYVRDEVEARGLSSRPVARFRLK